VEPWPVVRRVGDRDLFVGNERAADPAAHDRSFATVLSLSSDAHPGTTHHHPLTDGDDAAWSGFEAAVDAARALVARDGPTLIHCTAGVSRSPIVTATALSVRSGRPLRKSLEEVRRARPVATPHPRLRELAAVYLAARADRESG
jgi:atypical dual specificity phosphatase